MRSCWLINNKQKNEAMVKAYLRYEPFAPFGVIASTQSNIVLEEVILWDLEKGTEVRAKRDQ